MMYIASNITSPCVLFSTLYELRNIGSIYYDRIHAFVVNRFIGQCVVECVKGTDV